MYIKFKVEDVEIEIGGFNSNFEIEPFMKATVDGITNTLPEIKKLCKEADKLSEEETEEIEEKIHIPSFINAQKWGNRRNDQYREERTAKV